MTYNLYIYNKKLKEYEKKGEYKTRQMAETKSKPHTDKNKKIKIILMPEKDDIDIGFKVYNNEGKLYGEIIDKSKSFWFIRRSFKDKSDRAFFLKDSFLEKYENGSFIMKEENDGGNG